MMSVKFLRKAIQSAFLFCLPRREGRRDERRERGREGGRERERDGGREAEREREFFLC
jgi:hypothetical protein